MECTKAYSASVRSIRQNLNAIQPPECAVKEKPGEPNPLHDKLTQKSSIIRTLLHFLEDFSFLSSGPKWLWMKQTKCASVSDAEGTVQTEEKSVMSQRKDWSNE